MKEAKIPPRVWLKAFAIDLCKNSDGDSNRTEYISKIEHDDLMMKRLIETKADCFESVAYQLKTGKFKNSNDHAEYLLALVQAHRGVK